MDKTTSQDPKDTAQFDNFGNDWWDMKGPMAPLHQFTPIRLDYIIAMAKRAGLCTDNDNQTPFAGLSVLDIGCGGGLLAEPMARLGANVTAIDASENAIAAAKAHASDQGLKIDYRACLAEELAEQGQKFDILYSSEVIEHVLSRKTFISAIANLCAPEGLVVITTINRTLAALAVIKIGAEYITRQIPKGTHDYQKFVTPDELASEFRAAGILLDHFTGFVPTPSGRFRQSQFMGINYAASGRLA